MDSSNTRRPFWSTGSRRPRPISWRFFMALLRFIQRADLEHIWVVPSLAQRRMTEDKAQRLIEESNRSLSFMIRL